MMRTVRLLVTDAYSICATSFLLQNLAMDTLGKGWVRILHYIWI